MLQIKRKRPSSTPRTIVAIILLLAGFWAVLQFTLPSLMDSLYFRFFLLCFLGFGFLVISFLLKYA